MSLILARLDASTSPPDMNMPGLKLHPLKNSIKISGPLPFQATGVFFFVSKGKMP